MKSLDSTYPARNPLPAANPIDRNIQRMLIHLIEDGKTDLSPNVVSFLRTRHPLDWPEELRPSLREMLKKDKDLPPEEKARCLEIFNQPGPEPLP